MLDEDLHLSVDDRVVAIATGFTFAEVKPTVLVELVQHERRVRGEPVGVPDSAAFKATGGFEIVLVNVGLGRDQAVSELDTRGSFLG